MEVPNWMLWVAAFSAVVSVAGCAMSVFGF